MGDDGSDDSGSSSSGWGGALLSGVSSLIDSQIQQAYGVNNPVANTYGGVAGQAQATPAKTTTAMSPLVWVAIAGAFVVLVLVLKK